MLFILLSCIFAIPLIYIGLTFPIKYIMIRNFFSRLRKSEAICLTFDDGPHPQITPRILKILKKGGIKATFFLLGKNVAHGLQRVLIASGPPRYPGKHPPEGITN